MEGAGVAAAAARFGVPFAEMRAISNAVGPRDRTPGRSTPRSRRSAGRWPRSETSHEARLLALPERHLRLPRLGARPGRRRAAVEVTFADIDVTNTAAERGEFDVVKVSYAALPWLLDELRAAAVRRRARPRLRAAGADRRRRADGLAGRTVAVPSERSTAYLLFRLWASGQRAGGASTSCRSTRSCPRCATAEYDAGLVIHEARFTYPYYGLHRARRPRRVVGGRHRPADPARRDPRPPRRSTRLDWPTWPARRSSTPGRTRGASAAYVAEHADEMAPDVQASTSSSTSTSSPATSATTATPRPRPCSPARTRPDSRPRAPALR